MEKKDLLGEIKTLELEEKIQLEEKEVQFSRTEARPDKTGH